MNVEKIGDLIAQKKVPQLVDVRDESTDKVRVVLELKIPPSARRVGVCEGCDVHRPHACVQRGEASAGAQIVTVQLPDLFNAVLY